ncbi:putative chitin deacetylase, partial [Cladochytrium replicatum]
ATPTITSSDGTCGIVSGSVVICPTNSCCSQYGFCGNTTAHCDNGCQSAFGSCNPPVGRCGPYDGGATCPKGQCCSVHGWCGTTAAHCGLGCRNKFTRNQKCDNVTAPTPPDAKSGKVCQVSTLKNVAAVAGTAPRIMYGCTKPGLFALTYDDGVLKNYDPYLIDVLKAYDVKASWFVNGKNFGDLSTSEAQDYITRIHSAGHNVLSHTYS